MASSRSRDFSEEDLEETTVPLPEMMFAEGEEPVGVRVLTYQSSRALNTILEALESRVLYIPASRLRKYLLRIVALPATTFNPYIHHICYTKPENIYSSTDEIFVQQPAGSTLSFLPNLRLLMLPCIYCRFATSKLQPLSSTLMGSIPVCRGEDKYSTNTSHFYTIITIVCVITCR